ncbi:polysaccharide deacetylase family protein [Spongiivirga sp. MCCC 1A20706]|uniref:polysaccharide deacetylase family protein n=1 Tax=Spongiivirga sp. MCCC 1A20706 TaxID=3160963 RepID=UPI00397790E1
MLLIYTHKLTPRLRYAFKHVFTRVLKIPIEFTTRVEEFIAHGPLKMTYTKQPLQNEFFVKSHELLFDHGVGDVEINVQQWDQVACFFSTNSDKSILPYDIFAATFYLLSRYEEYIPHVKDEHGRYPVNESLAFKHKFLEQPVIDIWAYKLLGILQERFPELNVKQTPFQFTPVISVPLVFGYRKVGILRTISGTFGDLFRFRLRKVLLRYAVLFGIKKDPYDTFDDFINLHLTYKVKAIYFFLFAKYATYDKNISVYSNVFRSLIKSVSDYAITSLLVSYEAFSNIDVLKKERKRLSDLIHRPVVRVMQHYNKLDFPDTYRNLIDAEVNEDYTMGYPNTIGFRAGTCTPFYFYDIGAEMPTPLKINPVVTTDFALKEIGNTQQIIDKITRIGEVIEAVNGNFVFKLHNTTLIENEWKGWREIYIKTLQRFGSKK